MKAIKGIITVLLSIVLTILIVAFTLTFIIKNVVQNEIITTVVKETITKQYVKSTSTNSKERKAIEKLLNDKKADDLLNSTIDNYLNYRTDKNYSISNKDINKMLNYLLEHKEELTEINGSEVTEQMIRENVTKEKINKEMNNVYEQIDKNMTEETTKVIEVYEKTVSNDTKLLIGISIIICILLIMLINWSLIKWLVPTGISFILSGVLMGIIYMLFDFIKTNFLDKTDFNISLDNIKFTSIIVVAIIEIIIGVVLIIINKIFKKKKND